MKRLLVLLFCLFSTAAYADLAPPPCTIDSEKRPGEECGVCLLAERPDVSCQEAMQKKGFEKRCIGPGANGTEVWCGPAQPPAETPRNTSDPAQVPPPQKRGLCSVSVAEGAGGAILLFSLFVGLALLSRRSPRHKR